MFPAILCALLAAPQWFGPAPVTAPRRIVSLAPSTTEFICTLGACDRLVGVSRYDDTPPSVRSLPKVGGFVDLSLEAVTALHPDLVVTVPMSGGTAAAMTLGRLGLPVLVLPTETLDDMWAAIEALGQALPARQAAQREMQRLRQALQAEPGSERSPTVLLVLGRKPLVAAGAGTFLDTLLGLAGARNAVTAGKSRRWTAPYPVLDLEAAAQLDPDIIVDVASQESNGAAFWATAPFLRAVRTQRLAYLTDPGVIRPGPRLDEGLRQLRAAVRRALPQATTP